MGTRRAHSRAESVKRFPAAQAVRPTNAAAKRRRRLVTSTGDKSPAHRTRTAPVEKHSVAATAWATPVHSSFIMGADANTVRAKSQESRECRAPKGECRAPKGECREPQRIGQVRSAEGNEPRLTQCRAPSARTRS